MIASHWSAPQRPNTEIVTQKNIQGVTTTNIQSRAMEQLEDYNTYILGAISLAVLFVSYYFLRTDPEASVPYNVAPPAEAQPGWKGEILEEPSLKAEFVPHLHSTISSLTTCIGLWIFSHPMLLSRNRRIPWTRQSLYRRRHRPRHCQSKGSAGAMGEDNLRRAKKGAQDHVEVCLSML